MRNQYRIGIYRSGPWQDNLELHVYDNFNHGVAKTVEFEKAEEGMAYPPALYLDYTAAQQLMDSLWECGLRPSEGSGSAGAMKAVQDHLKDMRKLVSKSLEVDL